MRVLSDVLVGRAREAAAVAEKAASEALSASQAALLLIDAFAVRDWARLEASYHPDALITSIAGGMEPRTAAETVAAARNVSHGIFDVDVSSLTDLDERSCLASGRIRHTLAGGGFADHESHWLYVFKNGTVWRCVPTRVPAKPAPRSPSTATASASTQQKSA